MIILVKGKEKQILENLSSSINDWWLIFHEGTTKKIIKMLKVYMSKAS